MENDLNIKIQDNSDNNSEILDYMKELFVEIKNA